MARLHHAFPASIGTVSGRIVVGDYFSYHQSSYWQYVEQALADMVDEGIFLEDCGSNQAGKPVSHLTDVGHQLGSRKRYLCNNDVTESSKM